MYDNKKEMLVDEDIAKKEAEELRHKKVVPVIMGEIKEYIQKELIPSISTENIDYDETIEYTVESGLIYNENKNMPLLANTMFSVSSETEMDVPFIVDKIKEKFSIPDEEIIVAGKDFFISWKNLYTKPETMMQHNYYHLFQREKDFKVNGLSPFNVEKSLITMDLSMTEILKMFDVLENIEEDLDFDSLKKAKESILDGSHRRFVSAFKKFQRSASIDDKKIFAIYSSAAYAITSHTRKYQFEKTSILSCARTPFVFQVPKILKEIPKSPYIQEIANKVIKDIDDIKTEMNQEFSELGFVMIEKNGVESFELLPSSKKEAIKSLLVDGEKKDISIGIKR